MSNKGKISPILFVLFSCFLLNAKLSAQNEQRWLKIATDVEGTNYYIEKESRKTSGNSNIRTWEKRIRSDFSYSILLTEWNCHDKRERLIQFTDYNVQRRLEVTSEEPSDWHPIIPDSIAEKFFKIVCLEPPRLSAKVKISMKKYAEIIAKKAYLRDRASPSGEIICDLIKGEKLMLINVEPIGGWYKVVDSKTKSIGWLHGNTFKVISSINKPTNK